MATTTRPRPQTPARPPVVASPPPTLVRTRRERLAALERPLLLGGLALVTAHLLDLSFAGPDTTVLGIAAIAAAALGAALLQPRVTRPTRVLVAVATGVLTAAATGASHVVDLFTSGPRWTDLTGVAAFAGGLMLVAGGAAALAAPRGPSRASLSGRAAHAVAWLAGALVIGQLGLIPLLNAVVVTHAVRLPIDAAALRAPHETVHIAQPGGGRLAAWYVPSRNGAAVLVVHGSGSNRSKVTKQSDFLARAGYGVLALDLPGHGESDGRANLMGSNAQPAIDAALRWLRAREDVDPDRIAGLGTSLGGEVLLETAARDQRLRAVVSDGAERAADDRERDSGLASVAAEVSARFVRAVSGTREAPALAGLLPRIGHRRQVLLIAAGGRADEIPVNRLYRRKIGPAAELWTIPEAGHTRGVTARPREYAQRVIAFLDGALRDRDS